MVEIHSFEAGSKQRFTSWNLGSNLSPVIFQNFQNVEENRMWGLFCAILASGLSGFGSGITDLWLANRWEIRLLGGKLERYHKPSVPAPGFCGALLRSRNNNLRIAVSEFWWTHPPQKKMYSRFFWNRIPSLTPKPPWYFTDWTKEWALQKHGRNSFLLSLELASMGCHLVPARRVSVVFCTCRLAAREKSSSLCPNYQICVFFFRSGNESERPSITCNNCRVFAISHPGWLRCW